MKRLRIGTRGSALAMWQSRHVASLLSRTLPGMPIALVEITSLGDYVTDVPLSHVEGTGFFTATIEQALLANEVDIAVHSYKDCRLRSRRVSKSPRFPNAGRSRTCSAHAMAAR